MTVKELIDILAAYPEQTRVATRRYSEFRDMTPDDISTVRAFDNGGYLSHSYRKQDDSLSFEVVYFEGN